RQSDMTRHYRIHTNDRRYQCPLEHCGKKFIQRSALNVHERTHSGEKPHICQVTGCNKRFGDSSSLSRHRRIHSQTRSFVCDADKCSKSYTKKSHLIRHQRRTHAAENKEGQLYHMTTRAREKLNMSLSTDDDEEVEEMPNVIYAKKVTSSPANTTSAEDVASVHPNYWLISQSQPPCHTSPILYSKITFCEESTSFFYH
ncbi:hypothetical protein INT47_005268, partial [Mucor saturninus]